MWVSIYQPNIAPLQNNDSPADRSISCTNSIDEFLYIISDTRFSIVMSKSKDIILCNLYSSGSPSTGTFAHLLGYQMHYVMCMICGNYMCVMCDIDMCAVCGISYVCGVWYFICMRCVVFHMCIMNVV